MTTPTRRPDCCLAAVLGLLLLTGAQCQDTPTIELPPPAVTVEVPEEAEVRDYVEYTGNVSASQSVELRARVEGFLKEVKFQEGRIVEEGDLLFVIEPEPFEAKLAAAEAKLRQAESKEQLANANLARAKLLLEKSAISREEYDTLKAESVVAAANVEAEKASVEQASIQLGYTKVHAPCKGRIGRSLVDVGNLVSGQPSTLLTTIEATDPVHVYFDIGEKVVLAVLRRRGPENSQPNLPVKLGLVDEEGFPHEGELDFLDNRVDPGTGTALVRGVFKNTEAVLYPGLFVRVQIPLDPIPNALLVEERAIGTDLNGKYLLTVSDADEVLPPQYVTLGRKFGTQRLVVGGLESGQRYIVDGLQRARPGAKVKPVEEQPGPPAAAESKPEPATSEPSQATPEPAQ